VLESVSGMLEGFETMVRLASSPDNIIPGHDSTVLHPLTGRCRLNLTFRKALV
jgi:hypothetical protein